MSNRQPAIRRSQNPSSHQSIEDAPPMMRRMGGSDLSPKVWTQRSTPFARMILSLGSIGRISGPGLAVVAVRHEGSFLDGCSIVQLEHTAIDLRSTINPSPYHESVPTRHSGSTSENSSSRHF